MMQDKHFKVSTYTYKFNSLFCIKNLNADLNILDIQIQIRKDLVHYKFTFYVV